MHSFRQGVEAPVCGDSAKSEKDIFCPSVFCSYLSRPCPLLSRRFPDVFSANRDGVAVNSISGVEIMVL